jgi:hypothetical protein
MLQNEFDQELLADILVNAIYNIDNNNYDSNNDEEDIEGDAINQLAKENIIILANQLLSKETLSHYPEFKIKKPNLFSKLNDATSEAKNALETKRDILHQICINIMADFPELSSVSIENVEYGVIKIIRSNKTYDVTTHIVINDENQLKHDIKEFLNKS